MGIHGLLAQLGPGRRISLAKLSADHYTKHDRPLRLAIDISIWLFQIQSGKGGSNPALRTFYYRLLRLLTLNTWPLFVFDGPNKPLFKRNKRVGGPGVRVASVPEFLAKQLLKQFGFPWHVAPGEAEAECALLQREGIVDAVLSEDVDTLMFGSGVTIRNWSAENTTKSPTHVNLYRAEETKEHSGLDRESMILVALMSGGDYLPEGIAGCGPKLACDAARAGFGRDLCALSRKDAAGINAWKERLQHQIRTNEGKFFSRKNTQLTIPEEFPNLEVLGFYTNPCVSTPDKLAKLKQELKWDQSIDFPALRNFTADAFDWRCLGGAKKFIKNLAPAMLIRELRLRGNATDEGLDQEDQEQREQELVQAIHSTRNHAIVDNELEYRISFTPAKLVPIDLSIEEEDDQFVPAGGAVESDAESEVNTVPADNESEAPVSPKKRNFRPYDPSQPEKLWILKTFLQIGCPLLVEVFEASTKDPKEFLKMRRKARAAAKGEGNIHAKQKPKSKARQKENLEKDIPVNALTSYAKVTKSTVRPLRDGMKELGSSQTNERSNAETKPRGIEQTSTKMPTFQISATQPVSRETRLPTATSTQHRIEVLDLVTESTSIKPARTDLSRPFAAFARPKQREDDEQQRTPKKSKKRPSPNLTSPAPSQKTITSYYSPSPRKSKPQAGDTEIIDLVSSSPTRERPLTPSPPNIRFQFLRTSIAPDLRPAQPDFSPGKLPDTVTKRRKKSPLKRWRTEPALHHGRDGEDGEATLLALPTPASPEVAPMARGMVEVMDLITSPAARSDGSLESPRHFIGRALAEDDEDATPKASESRLGVFSLPPASPLGQGEEFEADEKVDWWFDGVQTDTSHTVLPSRTGNSAKPPTLGEELPLPSPIKPSRKPQASAKEQTRQPYPQKPTQHPPRRSQLEQAKTKKRIELRESLEGWWKEVDVETIDMSGNGSGWKKSGGRAEIVGPNGRTWRKSGVEVLDLTGA